MGQPTTAWVTTEVGHIVNLSVWHHVVVELDPANAGKYRVVAMIGRDSNPAQFCILRSNLTQAVATALVGTIATLMGAAAI